LAFYKVTQDIFEPDDVFYDRVWYICNGMATDTDANFETLVKKSRMRAAIKQYGCEYKSDVMSHVLTD